MRKSIMLDSNKGMCNIKTTTSKGTIYIKDGDMKLVHQIGNLIRATVKHLLKRNQQS